MSALKKKIQISPIFFDEPLQTQTNEFWQLSQAWHGRTESSLTLMDAMYISNKLLEKVSTKRKLISHVETIKNDMIVYGTKSKKVKIERLQPPKPSTEASSKPKIVLL